MAFILSFDGNYINKNTLNIVKKYSKLLDVKKTSILTKCITHNIKVKIIFYKMNNDDINLIITTSLINNDKYYLNYIDYNVDVVNFINRKTLVMYFYESLQKNNVSVTLFLMRKLQFDDDIENVGMSGPIGRTGDIEVTGATGPIGRTGDIAVTGFYGPSGPIGATGSVGPSGIFGTSGPTGAVGAVGPSNIFNYQNDRYRYAYNKENIILSMIKEISNNNFYVIKYFYKNFGLTKQDFQLHEHDILSVVCKKSDINIVKYFHKKIGLTKKDFQKNNNYVCRLVCQYGCIKIVKYLHEEIGLEKEDFQSDNNHACKSACNNNHFKVVKYLVKVINIF